MSFDPEWIKKNTDENHTLKCQFSLKGVNYDDECVIQTIHYDSQLDRYVMIDEWGGDTQLNNWSEVQKLLDELDVDTLMEMKTL